MGLSLARRPLKVNNTETILRELGYEDVKRNKLVQLWFQYLPRSHWSCISKVAQSTHTGAWNYDDMELSACAAHRT